MIEIPKIDETKKNISFKITPELFEQLEYSSRKLKGLFNFDVSYISNDKSQLHYECENLGNVYGIKSYGFKVDSNCEKDFKITLTRRQHKLMTKLLISNYTASLYENKYLILKNYFVPLENVPLQVIARHSNNSSEIIQSNYLDESNEMLVSEHNKLFGTTKTTKSKDKVKTK